MPENNEKVRSKLRDMDLACKSIGEIDLTRIEKFEIFVKAGSPGLVLAPRYSPGNFTAKFPISALFPLF
jgi:hypothetical protein